MVTLLIRKKKFNASETHKVAFKLAYPRKLEVEALVF